MEPAVLGALLGAAVAAVAAAAVWLGKRLLTLDGLVRGMRGELDRSLEEKHRAVLSDLYAGLGDQAERLEQRLDALGGRLDQRVTTGLRRADESMAQVREHLARIGETQRALSELTREVLSLQDLLGDKRARGALGEVQLEALLRNLLPPGSYALQHTLSTRVRVDCALFLPPPTGTVAVDAKFPLEAYERLVAATNDAEQRKARQKLAQDVRRHIDDIAGKYLVPGETAEGALMFVPAEAVFAEIHAHHRDVVEHGLRRRVFIVSPTTLMAVLNTARAVLRDGETQKQVHVLREQLLRLGRDFERFDERLRKLADHVRLAHEAAEDLRLTGRRLSARFGAIERLELGEAEERGGPGSGPRAPAAERAPVPVDA